MIGTSWAAKIASLPPPFHTSTPCLQATYYAFSDEEEKLIKEGQRDGLQQMLDSPQVC